MTEQLVNQAAQAFRSRGTSSIKEAVSDWSNVARLLRGGDSGALVPVVIPRDNRGLRWTTLVWFGLWALVSGLMLMGVGADQTQVIKGLVLLAAVAFDVRNKVAGKPSIIGTMTRRFSKDKAEPLPLKAD